MKIIYLLLPLCGAYFNRYLYNFYSNNLQKSLRNNCNKNTCNINNKLYKHYSKENFIYSNKIIKKKERQNTIYSIISILIFLKYRNVSIIIIAIINYLLFYKFKYTYLFQN